MNFMYAVAYLCGHHQTVPIVACGAARALDPSFEIVSGREAGGGRLKEEAQSVDISRALAAGWRQPRFICSGAANRCTRRPTDYFTFSQITVVTTILPSLTKGAGRVVYISLSPSFFTSLICVVPVQ